jgi:uridine kinase
MAQRDKPYIIGIAGGSGSGKTFFLKCFLEHFNSDQVSLLSQDDYYFPVGEKMTADQNRLYNFDVPEAIDREHFYSDVTKLISKETIYKKEYTFNNPTATAKMLEIKPAPILLVEGLFIFHFEEIARLLDLRIFIEADLDIALKRRLKRDLDERGYTYDDILYKWENHALPAYKAYLLPHKNGCERVVVNNSHMAEDIIRITESISKELKEKLLI